MIHIPDWINGAGALTQETKLERKIREQRPQRERIVVAALRRKKKNRQIVEELREAGLFHSNHMVDRWVRYYKWKMAIGEI